MCSSASERRLPLHGGLCGLPGTRFQRRSLEIIFDGKAEIEILCYPYQTEIMIFIVFGGVFPVVCRRSSSRYMSAECFQLYFLKGDVFRRFLGGGDVELRWLDGGVPSSTPLDRRCSGEYVSGARRRIISVQVYFMED